MNTNEFLSLNGSGRSGSEKSSLPKKGHKKTKKSVELPEVQDESKDDSIEDDPKKGQKTNDSSMDFKYWYRGELMDLVPDALEEIEKNPEVVVEQKIELLEILTGCETANRYNVYLLDKDKNKKFLLKCKESSSWCCRNCVPSNDRSFTLTVIHIKNSNKQLDYKKNLADFARPYQFTCGCLCRAKMIGYYGDENAEVGHKNSSGKKEISKNARGMGEIDERFACGCKIEVRGEDGNIKYKIVGDYCQCGYCCRIASIGKCYEVDFWIYDADADITTSKPVGNIHKVFKGLTELITDSDAYILTFPRKATAIERLLLIGSVILIDYRYYEEIALFDCGNII